VGPKVREISFLESNSRGTSLGGDSSEILYLADRNIFKLEPSRPERIVRSARVLVPHYQGEINNF
jgi:hypothetical protein